MNDNPNEWSTRTEVEQLRRHIERLQEDAARDAAIECGLADAMCAVAAELAKTGIGKNKKASGYGASFNFRGIDDVQAALAPLLPQHGLTMVPSLNRVDLLTRETSSGKVQYHALVQMTYVIHHTSGASVSGSTAGEAADTGDKAVGKAMSYALKAFILQTFCVPTQATKLDDPDATTHEPSKPVDYDVVPFIGDEAAAESAIAGCDSIESLQKLWRSIKAQDSFTEDVLRNLHGLVNQQHADIRKGKE